ncbi:MAG: rod shape-determining protein RodA [Janthinobacterium lividum]
MPRAAFVPAGIARLPWGVLALTFLIGSFGLVVLYSAAGGRMHPWALSQGIRFFVFLGGAAALSRVPERTWRAGALPAYGVLVVLLVVVEALGKVSGGSQRWISLGVVNLQPSELMKLAIVLAMARFYDMLPPSRTRSLASLLPAGLLIGVPAALIMLQPDLGTALMVSAGGVTVMFLAGVPLRLFGAAAVAMPIVGTLAFKFVLHDYQRNRILIFLDPESDPLRTGYHITQSKIAIGSGGFWGKGFLNGTQSHLDYLPEGHTDFALATMMEEWGFVGGCALILGFMLLVRWGVRVGQRAQTRFARLAAAGLATTIFFYFAINMAMVMGLAPVVGVPLPLISFGGSAQMTVLLCLGILMSLDRAGSRQSTGW